MGPLGPGAWSRGMDSHSWARWARLDQAHGPKCRLQKRTAKHRCARLTADQAEAHHRICRETHWLLTGVPSLPLWPWLVEWYIEQLRYAIKPRSPPCKTLWLPGKDVLPVRKVGILHRQRRKRGRLRSIEK